MRFFEIGGDSEICVTFALCTAIFDTGAGVVLDAGDGMQPQMAIKLASNSLSSQRTTHAHRYNT